MTQASFAKFFITQAEEYQVAPALDANQGSASPQLQGAGGLQGESENVAVQLRGISQSRESVQATLHMCPLGINMG